MSGEASFWINAICMQARRAVVFLDGHPAKCHARTRSPDQHWRLNQYQPNIMATRLPRTFSSHSLFRYFRSLLCEYCRPAGPSRTPRERSKVIPRLWVDMPRDISAASKARASASVTSMVLATSASEPGLSREQKIADLKAEALADLHASKSSSPERKRRAKSKSPDRHTQSAASLSYRWDEEDARPNMAPKASMRLLVICEHCTAPRPTTNLKGTAEKYAETCAKLESAFHAQFEDDWEGLTDFQINPEPSSLPHAFMDVKKALRFLKGYPKKVHDRIAEGTQVVDLADYPPTLQTYPRIGAFEVTFSMRDGNLEVARGSVYSKLATQKWPSVDTLVSRLYRCVQGELWKLHVQQESEAAEAARAADEQAEAAADAEEAAQREVEQAEAALAALAALRIELAAAEAEGDPAVIEDARVRLAALEARQQKEAAEAAEAVRRARELGAAKETARVRKEAAEALLAMQRYKQELLEWEKSVLAFQAALRQVATLQGDGDLDGAALARDDATTLREASERELGEARAAFETAATEATEAADAELDVALKIEAKTKGAASNADAAEAEEAEANVAEARVKVEDVQAQCAMAVAELEVREARALHMQAELAGTTAEEAALDPVAREIARKHAAELKARARAELAEAQEKLSAASREAAEAVAARKAKEEADAERARARLAAAEAALRRAQKGGDAAEIRAATKRVRAAQEALQREFSEAEAAAANERLTAMEMDSKAAALQELAADRSGEEAARRAADLALEAETAREKVEAKLAEQEAIDKEAAADAAERKLAEQTERVGSILSKVSKKDPTAADAMAKEGALREEAARLRQEAHEARARAVRERQEAQEAAASKEEVEAARSMQRYHDLDREADEMRARAKAAQAEAEAAKGGPADLAERAAKAAQDLMQKAEKLQTEAQEQLAVAQREAEEAAFVRQRTEVAQLEEAKEARDATRRTLAAAEKAAADAGKALAEAVGAQKEDASARKADADAALAVAQREADAAQASYERERGEVEEAAVAREAAQAALAREEAEAAAEDLEGLQLELSNAKRRLEVAKETGIQKDARRAEAAVQELTAKMKAAEEAVVATAERAKAEEEEARVARLQKEAAEYEGAKRVAANAEAAALEAELNSRRALEKSERLQRKHTGTGVVPNNAAKREMAVAADEAEQQAGRAARLRAEADRLKAEAEREAAEAAAAQEEAHAHEFPATAALAQ